MLHFHRYSLLAVNFIVAFDSFKFNKIVVLAHLTLSPDAIFQHCKVCRCRLSDYDTCRYVS